MKKYLHITKLWMERNFAYRARISVWLLRDLFFFFIFPFIWLTVFGGRTTLLGYTKNDMITYYIISAMINLIAMSYIARVTQQAIIRGDINKYLTQPVSFLWNQTAQAFAYKLIGCIPIVAGFVVIKFFFPQFFVLPASLAQWFVFLVSLILAFALSHCMTLAIGISAFWFGEINALDQSHDILRVLFSGQIAPLVFYPPLVQVIGAWLPFQYMSYVPVQIYLGQLTMLESLRAVGAAGLWAVGLWIFLKMLYARALRQYEGVGI